MLNINYAAFVHKIYVDKNNYHLSEIIETYLNIDIILLKY